MNLLRLDKIIASQFNISRSIARRDIHTGKVTVDEKVIRDPSLNVDLDEVQVKYFGQAVSYKQYIYIVMNKPKDVLSASTDKSRTTVVDLVPEKLRRANLAPVGRLDKDTTGLLIITDDGDFSHKVISPKSGIFKTYNVLLDGEVTDRMCESFAKGIVLADGQALRPARLKRTGVNSAQIQISEGRYHQIKRMFGVVGLGVNGLERIALGKFSLPCDLSYGECREMTEEEIAKIFID